MFVGAVVFSGVLLLTAPTASAPVPLAPTAGSMDWIEDVIDVIDDIIDVLEGAEDKVDEEAVAAPLKTAFEADLDGALDAIDLLYDLTAYPSLDPTAGAIDTTVQPALLSQYASIAVKLAQEARREVLTGPNFDADLVGTYLKTLENLIVRPTPHNYKIKAGV